MGFPSNKTLAKIAVYVAIGGMSGVMYMRWKVEDRIRNTEYFRSALQYLRQHRGAVSILGEPIKETGFDIGKPENNCDGQNAHFEVCVKGSKQRGKIFFWSTRDEQKGWLLDRLELELKTEPDKRYLIKIPPTEINQTD